MKFFPIYNIIYITIININIGLIMININDNNQFDEIWALVRDKLQEINGYDDIVMKLWFTDLKMTVLTTPLSSWQSPILSATSYITAILTR